MDPNLNSAPTQAHPETMDFLSRTWCNFAVQAFQPELNEQSSIVLLDPPVDKLEKEVVSPFMVVDKSAKMGDTNSNSLPPWKSNDVKSWIWMQQAMHPELNYNSCFRKKFVPWKLIPFKMSSIKKWLKEIKLKRKEEGRLQRAEVHAAISVAGVAAALAAIAVEGTEKGEASTATRDAAVASAAALVAAQCAQAAEAMGAKKDQLSSVIKSAISSTSASDILTLTAAATTSLRGAATLKARTGCRNRLNGTTPILPIEDNHDIDFDVEKCRSQLAKGAFLNVETPDGRYVSRSVSVILNSDSKVILQIRSNNLLKSKKESIVLDLHAELYKNADAEETETCYLIVLRTNCGIIKLDMSDNYQLYKTWATTINHMLTLSTSLTNYELQFCKQTLIQ